MTSEEHYEWETDSWKDKQNVIISMYWYPFHDMYL